MRNRVRLLSGDCRRAMRLMAQLGVQVDSIVTDPPYHLTSIVKRFGDENPRSSTERRFGKPGSSERTTHTAPGVYKRHARGFMGKKWDGGAVAFDPETWALALAVLKPGGHMLCFGGTRGWHRLACAIEDAGFEIRDTVAWIYGSGFPKSHDVSKGIDKMRRRDFVLAALNLGMEIPGRSLDDWTKEEHSPGNKWWDEFKSVLSEEQWQAIEREVVGKGHSGETAIWNEQGGMGNFDVTAPATPEAERWQGWGTALKPAFEPIVLARRPCSEKSVAANVLRHGTGAINIDGCRVETEGTRPWREARRNVESDENRKAYGKGLAGSQAVDDTTEGRWPANVAHDGSEEVEAAFAAFGENKGQLATVTGNEPSSPFANVYGDMPNRAGSATPRDGLGSASRFFYSSKADALDRFGSKHPTVKPVDLMRWLVRLVTPPGGLVLDPFAGSGTTGVAAIAEGFRAILIEAEPEYQADIRERLAWLSGEGGHSASVRQRHRDPPKSHGPLFEEAAE